MDKISTKEIYKKHKKNCKDEGVALRLSMKELHKLYSCVPINRKLYKRYSTLKMQNFHIYTILPQILISVMIGLATGIVVGGFQNNIVAALVVGLIVLVVCIIYVFISALVIFKTPVQILIEFQIKLIENKIDCDLKPHKRVKCKIKEKN